MKRQLENLITLNGICFEKNTLTKRYGCKFTKLNNKIESNVQLEYL